MILKVFSNLNDWVNCTLNVVAHPNCYPPLECTCLHSQGNRDVHLAEKGEQFVVGCKNATITVPIMGSNLWLFFSLTDWVNYRAGELSSPLPALTLCLTLISLCGSTKRSFGCYSLPGLSEAWSQISGISHWHYTVRRKTENFCCISIPVGRDCLDREGTCLLVKGFPDQEAQALPYTTRGHNSWDTARHTNRVYSVMLHQNNTLWGYYSFLIIIFWEPLCRIWKASSPNRETFWTSNVHQVLTKWHHPLCNGSTAWACTTSSQDRLAWIPYRTPKSSCISATVLVFHSSLTYCPSGNIFFTIQYSPQ